MRRERDSSKRGARNSKEIGRERKKEERERQQ